MICRGNCHTRGGPAAKSLFFFPAGPHVLGPWCCIDLQQQTALLLYRVLSTSLPTENSSPVEWCRSYLVVSCYSDTLFSQQELGFFGELHAGPQALASFRKFAPRGSKKTMRYSLAYRYVDLTHPHQGYTGPTSTGGRCSGRSQRQSTAVN